MAHTVKIIFGAIALAASLGVAQLAVGGDLAELRGRQDLGAQHLSARDLTARDLSAQHPTAQPPMALSLSINRAAKADRATLSPAAPGHTISVWAPDQADSSFLVRIPSPSGEARRLQPSPLRAPAGKSMVACEPMVSVLTEIAKQLQPGRCVT
jgi:hypothetical protein